MSGKIIVICGPTASGKTALSIELARRFDGEVVSADSMQIYRRMDIGTAKPTPEERAGVPHHMLDVADPGEGYSVARYVREAGACVEDILSRGKRPIVCGGTGMYVESVLRGYRLLPVPENPALRQELEGRSLQELTQLLSRYKMLHNTTDVDTPKRAIRAIEIEEYYAHTPPWRSAHSPNCVASSSAYR